MNCLSVTSGTNGAKIPRDIQTLLLGLMKQISVIVIKMTQMPSMESLNGFGKLIMAVCQDWTLLRHRPPSLVLELLVPFIICFQSKLPSPVFSRKVMVCSLSPALIFIVAMLFKFFRNSEYIPCIKSNSHITNYVPCSPPPLVQGEK